MDDPYIDPELGILRNMLDITNAEELEAVESDILYFKTTKAEGLFSEAPLNFQTLLDLHKFLFGDIYDWAGNPRTIDIYKQERVLNGLSLDYEKPQNIVDAGDAIIEEMNNIPWTSMKTEEIIIAFSRLIAALWLVHPFREGNTRTIMQFGGIFAHRNKFELNTMFLNEQHKFLRNSLVLYSVKEAPEKQYLEKIMRDAIDHF